MDRKLSSDNMSSVRKLSHRSKQPQWKALSTWKIPEPGPRQRSAFRNALSETTLSFCQETSLHGVRNVVDDIRQLGSTRYSKYVPELLYFQRKSLRIAFPEISILRIKIPHEAEFTDEN